MRLLWVGKVLLEEEMDDVHGVEVNQILDRVPHVVHTILRCHERGPAGSDWDAAQPCVEVSSAHCHQVLTVHHRVLRRALMQGRYKRCDVARHTKFDANAPCIRIDRRNGWTDGPA